MRPALGWLLSGWGVCKKISFRMKQTLIVLKSIANLLKWKFGISWKVLGHESIGIRGKETIAESFTKTISFSDERNSVSFIFRENFTVLPENYVNIADSTVKRQRKELELLKVCDCTAREKLDEWKIEEVDVKKPVEPWQVYYLPRKIVTRKEALTYCWDLNGFGAHIKNSFKNYGNCIWPTRRNFAKSLEAKLLFQDLCCLKINWDINLSAEHRRISTDCLSKFIRHFLTFV